MTVPLIHVGWKLTALHFVDQTGKPEALSTQGSRWHSASTLRTRSSCKSKRQIFDLMRQVKPPGAVRAPLARLVRALRLPATGHRPIGCACTDL